MCDSNLIKFLRLGLCEVWQKSRVITILCSRQIILETLKAPLHQLDTVISRLLLLHCTYFTMVIGREFSHWTSQLGHFDFFIDKISLEASKENFSLTRLQTVNEGRNRSLQVHVGEQDELTIDELVECDSSSVLSIQIQLQTKPLLVNFQVQDFQKNFFVQNFENKTFRGGIPYISWSMTVWSFMFWPEVSDFHITL